MTQPQDRTKTSAPDATSAFHGYTHVHYTDVTFDLLDPGNVVYHPNYLVMSDRARSHAFDDLGYGLRDLWAQGYALAVRELSTEFLLPVLAGAQVAILSQLAVNSSRSIRVRQRFVARPDVLKADRVDGFVEPSQLLESELVLNQMHAKLVCVDLRKQRAAHLPASLARAIERLEQAPEQTRDDLEVRRRATSRWSDLRAWVRDVRAELKTARNAQGSRYGSRFLAGALATGTNRLSPRCGQSSPAHAPHGAPQS